MKLCSNNHEVICYNSRHCPLCKAKKEISEWEILESNAVNREYRLTMQNNNEVKCVQ
jgi:glutaredoxin